VAVDVPSEAFFAYRYYLGRGNNHPLVKACFRARGHWIRLKREEEMEQANIVWTQSKVKSLFSSYPVVSAQAEIHSKPGPIVCSVKVAAKRASCSSLKVVDIKPLGFDLVTQSPSFLFLQSPQVLSSATLRTHNKLEHNYHLANKKTLFYSMKKYYEALERDPFQVLPLTFHIQDGPLDPEFARFQAVFSDFEREKSQRNIWIVKPGENTNRGTGITVCSGLEEIRAEVSGHSVCPLSGQKRTFILQKYIENPLLVHKRKFDIRCYGLVTAINGVVQGYYYKEGYLRTSSKEFSLKDVENRLIHLTNDAVQKYSEDYGKFESGNKLSYSDFQRYLDTNQPGASVSRDVLPQIRQIVKETFEATFAKVNFNQRVFSFEVFGYDFMVDSALQVWLIEVNTNPCLELSSPLLARIIPAMLDNAFRIAVDPYFPEPAAQRRASNSLTGEAIAENRFELVFHSKVEGQLVKEALGERFRSIEDFDKTLQDMPEEEEMDESNEASEDGC
jgi:tubulin polyglutamylase TTLL1/tubulin monoglycylase TTLL3/8